MSNLIHNTISFVKEALQNAEGGHDWFHIERVYKNALLIAQQEDCNIEVVALGALLPIVNFTTEMKPKGLR